MRAFVVPIRQVFFMTWLILYHHHKYYTQNNPHCEWQHKWLNNWNKAEKMRHNTRWAATWQNQQSDSAPSEDSDQPGHPPSQIRLGGCPGWSESSMGAQSLCWFYHVAAQIIKFSSSLLQEYIITKNKIHEHSIKRTHFEPLHEKTCFWCLRPGMTQTSLLRQRD